MFKLSKIISEIKPIVDICIESVKFLNEKISEPIEFCDDVCGFCENKLVFFHISGSHERRAECIICKFNGESKYKKTFHNHETYKTNVIVGGYMLEAYASEKSQDKLFAVEDKKPLLERIYDLDFDNKYIFICHLTKRFKINFKNETENDKKIKNFIHFEKIFK